MGGDNHWHYPDEFTLADGEIIGITCLHWFWRLGHEKIRWTAMVQLSAGEPHRHLYDFCRNEQSNMAILKKTYYLGIGSNTARVQNINSCIEYLNCSFSTTVVSPTYRSPSFGFNGHDFYNLVVRVDSVFSPHQLKQWIQSIEDLHGRDRSKPRYSNRTLDIDLLLCNDMIIDDGFIQIPRAEILKRKYVLKPLQDLAPDLIHPLAQKRLADLWQALSMTDRSELTQITYQ